MGACLHNKNFQHTRVPIRDLWTSLGEQNHGKRIYARSGFSVVLLNSTHLHSYILSSDWNSCMEKESGRNAGEQGRTKHKSIENQNCPDAGGCFYNICPLMATIVLITTADTIWTGAQFVGEGRVASLPDAPRAVVRSG